MLGSFTVSKDLMVRLIDYSTQLQGPEPWIPGLSPDPRNAFRSPWTEVSPQDPIPIRIGWASIPLARAVLDHAFTPLRGTWAATTDEKEMTLQATRTYLSEVVDDFCGTGPHRWPLPFPTARPHFPWPWPGQRPDEFELNALDLLVIGAQFQIAADVLDANPLRDHLAAMSDRLLEAGLNLARQPE